MEIVTTDSVPGREIRQTLGIVAGEAVLGVNVFRDIFAGLRDIVGGRSGGYQKSLKEAREAALADLVEEARALGADAVVGIDLDYEAVGGQNAMLMVSANGTAVKLA
jgi:uncharacterized protein YbjQ (UPF0145 family)